MSNQTTVFNAIVAKLTSVFSSKQRLHNPYEIIDNPDIILKDSWGIKVGPSSQVDMEFCNLSTERLYTIVLVRQFATVGNLGDAFDAVSKLLMEDQDTISNHSWSPTELGIPDTVNQITIDTISGIEFIRSTEKKYLFCEVSIKILTSEAII